MSDAQRPLTMRAAALAAAAVLVGGAVLIAIGLRFPLFREEFETDSAVLSEVMRQTPEPLPTEPRVQAPLPTADAEAAPAAPAMVQPSSETVQIDTPRWLTRPRNPERFYPREAFMQGVEGRVELACIVEIDGRLSCEVVSETPAGRGFGDAALALARAHTMQPAMLNGAPVRGRYRMIVPFSAAE